MKSKTNDELKPVCKVLGVPLVGRDGKSRDKRELADKIVLQIETLFPIDCQDCGEKYRIELGKKPILRCFLCGQGAHACKFSVEGSRLGSVWLCFCCWKKNEENTDREEPEQNQGPSETKDEKTEDEKTEDEKTVGTEKDGDEKVDADKKKAAEVKEDTKKKDTAEKEISWRTREEPQNPRTPEGTKRTSAGKPSAVVDAGDTAFRAKRQRKMTETEKVGGPVTKEFLLETLEKINSEPRKEKPGVKREEPLTQDFLLKALEVMKAEIKQSVVLQLMEFKTQVVDPLGGGNMKTTWGKAIGEKQEYTPYFKISPPKCQEFLSIRGDYLET
eukprot:sb/3466662/